MRPERREVIDDNAFTRIMAELDLLGAAVDDGGFDDEQIMRIMMLVAWTGRRISEIRMLDRDPLFPLPLTQPVGQGAASGGALVAKLRYQQTKIEQAPDTILVDAEVVAIIREQQRWATLTSPNAARPARTPKYLFLAPR